MTPLEKRIGRYHIFYYASPVEPDVLLKGLFAAPLMQGQGRGGIRLIDMDATRLVARKYTHGGLFRAFTRDLFVDEGRATAEAQTMAYLRERSFPVVAPFCAVVKKGLIFRRLYLVTIFEEHAVSLLDYLKQAGSRQRLRMAKQLAGALWDLECSGVYHPDLHPGNVLVRPDGSLVFLDFDRARRGGVTPEETVAMMRRLGRFVDKLERTGVLQCTAADRVLFLRTYERLSGRKLLATMTAMQGTRNTLHRIAWFIESLVYGGKQ
jgi:serine/threonine protein kinase